MQTSRRCFVLSGLTILPAFSSDFWKQTNPSEWSSKEIRRFLTNSPWAKSASVDFSMSGMEGGPDSMGGPPPGGPPPGGPGGGMGRPPGGPGGEMRGPPNMPNMNLTVVWESAEAVRLASKGQAVEPAPNTYILGLSGLAMFDGPNPQQMLNRLKQTAKLSRKGKDPLSAATMDSVDRDAKKSVLLSFEAGPQPIDLDDKSVEFSARMGPLQIRALFIPKEMVFQGKLRL